MAHVFPQNPVNNQIEEIQTGGTAFVYRYNETQNTWELQGQSNTGGVVIFTSDVIATPEAPRPDPAGRQASYALDPNDIDFSKLTDQRIINWTLNDVIISMIARIEALENAL